MNAPAVASDLDTYIADVERLLDDLSDEDRRELMDDVREHLTEVAAEGEGTLVERLGPPAVYAAELRSSAGLPPYVAVDTLPATERLRRRLRASSLGTIAELPAVRAVRSFLPELRPAWWVVRGYLVAVLIDAMFFSANADGGLPWPSFGGSAVLGTIFVIACVVLSIVAGRATMRDARSRALALVANVAIVLIFAAALPRYEVGSASVNIVGAEPAPFGLLQHGDGSPITTICAYDSDGKRMKDVQLFDQDGRPIAERLRGKPGVVVEDGPGPIRILPGPPGMIDSETGETEAFECPKKLEDLRSKADTVERGLIRKKLLEERVLRERLRPFVVD